MRTKTVGGKRRSLINPNSPFVLSTLETDEEEDPNPIYRKSTVWNEWVIFKQDKTKKASDFKGKSTYNTNPSRNKPCVYCIGHEDECSEEIFRVPFDEPNWKIRVVESPNPAVLRSLDDGFVLDGGEVLDGFGIHDVVIESPVHSEQLLDLTPKDVGEVFVAFSNRIRELVHLESIKYVQENW